MRTIYELYKPFYLYRLHPVGTFGIEIETETVSGESYGDILEELREDRNGLYYPNPTENWRATLDGSLRNFGVEFVLKKPLSLSDAFKALDEFDEKIAQKVNFIQGAPGTSVHVHINMLRETPLTLAKFLVIWVLCENLLLEFSGQTRRSNLYALGSRVAETVVDNYTHMFRKMVRHSYDVLIFPEQDTKYSALNIQNLASKGTVEARCFRGTTNVSEIKEWLMVLNSLLAFARSDIYPNEILLNYRDQGLEFIKNIFPEELVERIVDPMFAEKLIDRNLVYCQWLVESVEDWKSFCVFEDPSEPQLSGREVGIIQSDSTTTVASSQPWSRHVSVRPSDEETTEGELLTEEEDDDDVDF